MRKTEKYQLPQWDKEDRIMMEDFNEAMDNIEDGIESAKAETAAVREAVGSGGKTARIAWGSYVGTDKHGVINPNTITVDFKPMVVFVSQDVDFDYLIMWRPHEQSSLTNQKSSKMIWEDHSVSWYSEHQSDQMNMGGSTYHWVIIGESD